jgi:hypothetical protein
VGEQFEPRNLESFNPVTQELYRVLPAMIHIENHKHKRKQMEPWPHWRGLAEKDHSRFKLDAPSVTRQRKIEVRSSGAQASALCSQATNTPRLGTVARELQARADSEAVNPGPTSGQQTLGTRSDAHCWEKQTRTKQ